MSSLFGSGGGKRRFELPALNLDFGNITDGTSIPPPPDSPVEEAPPPPEKAAMVEEVVKEEVTVKNPEPMKDTTSKPGRVVKPAPTNGNVAGMKLSASSIPASSSRPGSLRRLFSRNKLNGIYAAEGQLSVSDGSVAPVGTNRPVSQGAGSFFNDDGKSKRSSGWFKRLRSSDSSSRRTSMAFEEQPPPTPKRTTGPPPPMIPELTDLEKDEGSLGSDLFKNIK